MICPEKERPKSINYDEDHDVMRLKFNHPFNHPTPPFLLEDEEKFPGVYFSEITYLHALTILDYSMRSLRELFLLVPTVDWIHVIDNMESEAGLNRVVKIRDDVEAPLLAGENRKGEEK